MGSDEVSLWRFFFVRDVRKCPKCKVRIEKNGGCPHMNCQRCHYDFCWCCMDDYKKHNRWYSLCPALPFSICVNILLVVLFMALQHAFYVLGAIGFALYWWVYLIGWGINKRNCIRKKKGLTCCLMGFAWFLFCTAIVLPIYLALAGLAAGLAVGLLTVPCIYYGIAYIVRVIYKISIA